MQKGDLAGYYSIDAKYHEELYLLQVELLKLQRYISEKQLRLMILFEGRDTAGKGRAIFRFSQFLNPQGLKIVTLGKPTELERGQWYFQRHFTRLPNKGEIALFDRSWYNRAVVEPVMGFCTDHEYRQFMGQVNHIEQFLTEDGIVLIKFWFSIAMDEQKKRIQRRLESDLMRWKVSPVDLAAQEKWEDFTKYKNEMFRCTSTDACPWLIVQCPEREESRLQAMRYVLSKFDYPGKSGLIEDPDGGKVFMYEEE